MNKKRIDYTFSVLDLEAVIESSYDGIFVANGEGVIIKINKAYEDITGFKREDLIGTNINELIKKNLISNSASLLVIKSKKTETIVQQFSNSKKVMSSATPIFDEYGNVSMIVTNVRDVTQLYNLREELEKNKELAEKYCSEIKELRAKLLDKSAMIVQDTNSLQTLQIAKKVALVDTTVMLLGETGVGKEEYAKYIHKNSTRSKKQFIKINCGAIPSNLIESELFGYEKGAFTGANKEGKKGSFELASGGTIFLDEVGELPLDMQVKLLRALQEREIERIGGTKPIKIDVRVIAATNRELEVMIKDRLFREDLYYRLNVVPIIIPPLRKRKEDILPLINSFLLEFNEKFNLNKTFDVEAIQALCSYDWPGNVRELKNIVERVIIMSHEEKITIEDLPSEIVNKEIDNYVNNNYENQTLKSALEKLEEKMIKEAFIKYGNVRSAAKALGIDASTFVRKRQKYIKNI